MDTLSSSHSQRRAMIEPLEARIAPAVLTGFVGAGTSNSFRLDADSSTPGIFQGLSTQTGGGSYLIWVEKGSCVVYTTDLNGNNSLDFNEITGISAGDGLRMISFVDIHGDIVTNLNSDFSLTDSDNDESNGRDGRVLLNNRIEKIELRSITSADVPAGVVLKDRVAYSNYSIFGNIYAGKGFGATNGGLIIDDSGAGLQSTAFGGTGKAYYQQVNPMIGSIKVGTAASGQLFNFSSIPQGPNNQSVFGELVKFTPEVGQSGADIIGIKIANNTDKFDIGTLQAGDGGVGGRGGDVVNVTLTGDTAGGYKLIAGNAGNGTSGARGGNITNYADLGSFTSEVLIKAGNGGNASQGVGGVGGSITFNPAMPVNIYGRFIMTLGNGGDGLTGGGAGGSMPAVKITSPDSIAPTAQGLVASMHVPGAVGVQSLSNNLIQGIDFDNDGFNDTVYSTSSPNQLVVLFGDGSGLFDNSRTIFLNGPASAKAITVGDFNGDGHPDIAAAASDGSQAGVAVFLSHYDPVSDLFDGFRDPLYSALPTHESRGDLLTTVEVLAIAAGDFDGDGATDLGVCSVEYYYNGSIKTEQVVTLLTNDTTGSLYAGGSGFFHADYSASPGLELIGSGGPSFVLEGLGRPILHATAMDKNSYTHDVLVVAEVSDDIITVLDYTTDSATTFDIGQVDVDRNISDDNKNDKRNLQDAFTADFTIVDVNSDGWADLFVLTEKPDNGFLISYKGDGTAFNIASSPTLPTNPNPLKPAGENIGIRIAGSDGLNLPDSNLLVGILPLANKIGASDVFGVTIVDYDNDQASIATNITFAANLYTATKGASVPGIKFKEDNNTDVLAFDTYRPTDNYVGQQINIGHPEKANPLVDNVHAFNLSLGASIITPMARNGVFITAGDGGDGRLGAGGNGGTIGNGSLTFEQQVATGSIDILLPGNRGYEGSIILSAGNGGNGFGNAGNGGRIYGVAVDYNDATIYTSVVELFAGSGGNSRAGAGGSGGSLSAFSIISGSVFYSGNGGSGVTGGSAGNVVGSNVKDIVTAVGNNEGSNSDDTIVVVQTGHGGNGNLKGGAGGSILNFTPHFLPVVGGDFGVLQYTTGYGGASVFGAGGEGGSIIDSSPVGEDNNLSFEIYLEAGNGGNGASGGAGGSIRNFKNASSIGLGPNIMTAIAGNGGSALGGTGGAGGTISEFTATADGFGFHLNFDFSNRELVDYTSTSVSMSRVIAGNGGNSAGGKGGAGGNLTHIEATSSSSSLAAVAGAGGDGLRSGGTGGSVTGGVGTKTYLNAGSSDIIAKLLVIAGQGGNVTGAKAFVGPLGDPTTGDPLAAGGVNGIAGNGGSISNVIQNAGKTQADLIAGNGGDTVNYGTSSDTVTGVGKGGSISDITITHVIGNSDADVAIKAYNNIFIGERVSNYVKNGLMSLTSQLDDTIGNVGIIVGEKGRVRDNDSDGFGDALGYLYGTSGSLLGVTTSSLMSAVAGSVDRVAAIKVVSGINVSGTLGADKTVANIQGVDYFSAYKPANLALLVPFAISDTVELLAFDNPLTEDNAAIVGTNERIYETTNIGSKLVDGIILAQGGQTNPSNPRDFR